MKIGIFIIALQGMVLVVSGQRQYASGSVLASGQWLKISTERTGIYKVSAEMLQNARFGGNISSSSIRLFGNGGGVLPEANDESVADDLTENAISVFDGGDGVFSGQDYFLFYARGADQWTFDQKTKDYLFKKNPYSSISYYFISSGNGTGKRIGELALAGTATQKVSEFDEHYHHELDSINFLKSGKEWYGEEFNEQQGSSKKNFVLPFSGLSSGSSFFINSEVVGRSSGQPNKITLSINGQLLFEHTTQPLIGTLIEQVANVSRQKGTGLINATKLDIGYNFIPGSINAKAWLNWFDIFFRRPLDMQGIGQLSFRDKKSLAVNAVAGFTIKSFSAASNIWQVTISSEPKLIKASVINGEATFSASTNILNEYIAFDESSLLQPKAIGLIANQNLHAIPQIEMVIVLENAMITEANRLANFHQTKNGLKTCVVEVGQVYNEFSSGTPDPTAIRNFVKMFYDRAGTDIVKRPRYLLFMGGASYKLKEKNSDITNKIPSYQSESSLDPLTSYVTDDYFGFLDDDEDINKSIFLPKLDIAIGRIPARTLNQCRIAVDKIILYHAPASFGPWRSKVTLVADDEDYNIHFNDAEYHANVIEEQTPALNLKKIYLDAFAQESGTGGSRYPEVNNSINQLINRGNLIWNYTGHGGSSRLAQEAILDKSMAASWKNENKLSLFITATCDFAPFDDPSQFSIGEDLLVGRNTGAIALLTTTRLVFASSNRLLNNNYFRFALKTNSEGRYPTLGESLKASKNYTVSTSGDYINARKFILLGDPAMRIAIPEYKIITSTINGKLIGLSPDTLRALNEYIFGGEVLTPQGLLAADFNGYAYPVLYDKKNSKKTLGNDALSNAVAFQSQENILYSGKVKVENGKFLFNCIVPKDVNLEYGIGKLSYYAENGQYDAAGADLSFVVGGLGGEVKKDAVGPQLNCFLNTEKFINGQAVNETSWLIVKLFDSSAINISGIGIGHDITATIDENFRQTYTMNDFFEPAVSGFLKGTVKFQLPRQVEGNHQLVVRAWDVFNNSGECKVTFKVVAQKNTEIISLKNYPNPITSETTFSFQLGGLTGLVGVELQVLTMQGQVVREIEKTINAVPDRSMEVVWNGRDIRGNKPPKGIYVYRLVVKNAFGQTTQKVQKLVIL